MSNRGGFGVGNETLVRTRGERRKERKRERRREKGQEGHRISVFWREEKRERGWERE